ncbi:MAG: carboxylesterase family protein [Actinoallomurus sp.]
MIVHTGLGRVRGLAAGDVTAFRGIPYAAPLRGPLRFRPPTPPAAWDGVRDCVEFGSAPPQLPPAPGVPPLWRPELGLDCLTLNVWTRRSPPRWRRQRGSRPPGRPSRACHRRRSWPSRTRR